MARPQTELNIGQLNLSPTVQGAGRNQVFVAPLPRQNRAQMLAKNLAQFSTVLGQFSNIQAQRGEEKALRLTDQQVIDQVESNLPEGFNPFDKIGFDKAFSRKRYDRYYDLKIKDKIQQLSFEIKRAGPDKIGNKGFLQDIITDGLAKIDNLALEYIGDNVHMLNRHREVMGQVSAGLRFNENIKFEKGQVDWLKANSVESFDSKIAEGVQQGMLEQPKGARKPLLDGWISTFYGLESIDDVTKEDQRKADAGVPGYEGFSQTVGASGRKLIPGYSVASNYFPQGTLLNITFEGEDKPSIYRVDDIGGMDTVKKIDFFAGADKKLKEKFRLGKIKDVEYAELKSNNVTKSMTQVLQSLITEGDNDLYNSFHQDPTKRVDLLRSGLISAALVEREKGNIDKSEAILDSLPNLTLEKGQKLFGSVTGQAAYQDALDKADAIDLKNEENNSKIINERASTLNQIYTNDTISLMSDPDKEIVTLDQANSLEVIDEVDILIDKQLRELRSKREEELEKNPNSLEVKILNKAIEDVQEDEARHNAKILSGGKALLEGSNSFERYKNTISSKLADIQNKIFSNKKLKGELWKENESSYAPELIDKNLLENLISEEQTNFYDRNVEAVQTLVGANPTIPEYRLQPEINQTVDRASQESLNNINRILDDYINEVLPKQGEVDPTGTQFEREIQKGLMEGDTLEEAKRFGLSETLKDKETFDAKEGRVILDLDKVFGFGDSWAGNYEKEDFDKYKSLYEKTKETGVFKGKNEDVSRYYQNKKTILKESDFFAPLVTTVKRFTYERPSLTEMGVGGLYPSGVYKSTETEYRNAKRDIRAYLIETGVTLEDAQQGMFMDYPLKEIIQRNWEKMPILSFNELQFTGEVEKILKKNNLDKPHYMRDSFGNPVTKPPVTVDQFIAAQRKLITDQTK
jgi:hypothetical protein